MHYYHVSHKILYSRASTTGSSAGLIKRAICKAAMRLEDRSSQQDTYNLMR